MTYLCDLPLSPLQFYATAPYNCSYLPERMARSQVATPAHLIDSHTYSGLVQMGFRRSGIFTYRPWCSGCRACLPLRVDVAAFRPNRIQRRTAKYHRHLTEHDVPLVFSEEHYDLYQRYQAKRHLGGGMDGDSRDQYAHFLLQSHVHTKIAELREEGVLRGVTIYDLLDDGLSAVYTFFDPDVAASFGTYAILRQIAWCRALGLPYLYLGYWIKESAKMSYKINFKPYQIYVQDCWQRPDGLLQSPL